MLSPGLGPRKRSQDRRFLTRHLDAKSVVEVIFGNYSAAARPVALVLSNLMQP